MIERIGISILNTLGIMLWMGLILILLCSVNTVCSMAFNMIEKKESFDLKRFFQGIGKTLLFYGSSIAVAIAFTIIPFVNEMVTNVFGQVIISNDILQELSGFGVLGVCIAVIINQGRKAYEGILKLGEITSDTEEITWEVEDE